MDNGASSYRRFLEGDESAFDEIMKELFDGLVFLSTVMCMTSTRPRILPSMLFPIWWSINIGTISR